MFSEKLRNIMQERNLNATELSDLSGIGKSSISQYLSGKNEPTIARKKAIARSLSLPEDYFSEASGSPASKLTGRRIPRLPTDEAASIMGVSRETVCNGLKQKRFPWGYAVRGKGQWTYWINANKFAEIEGVNINDT